MLSISWWFQLVPIWSSFSLRVLFSIALLLMIIGALARWIGHRRLASASSTLVSADRITIGMIVGGAALFLYWFMSFEQIPLLSARFWLPVFFLIALWWAGYVFKQARLNPVQAQEQSEYQKNVKYFRMRR